MRQQCIRERYRYEQSRLLDELIRRNELKNDAALCRILQITPSVLSKIRHGRARLSGDVMIRMHEAFEIPISELRQLMAS